MRTLVFVLFSAFLYNASVVNASEYSLHEAVKEKNLEKVQELLSHKASINETDNQGLTALIIAAATSQLEIVKALLHSKASIYIYDSHGRTALHFAAKNGGDDVVKVLLEFKADTTIEAEIARNTALHFAASNGYLNVVSTLLDHGANINAINDYCWKVGKAKN